MSSLSDDDRENLTAYLDGELDVDATQALEAKLNQDPEARAELEALKRTWSLLDFLPKNAPSADFTNRTIDRLEIEKKKDATTAKVPRYAPTPAWVKGAVAVGVVLALGAGFLAGKSLASPHEDAILRNYEILPRWREYDAVDDYEFLQALDHPDLFGDEETQP